MKKLPRSKCSICNQECKRSTTKFCSIECRGKWQKGKRFGGPKLKVKARKCKHCFEEFFPNDYKNSQKYCTQTCMGLARADFCSELGKKMRGKKLSKEVRRKISIAASKRNASRQYTKGKGGNRKDIGHYVRSKWEANIARVLIKIYGSYEYEPETFPLDDGDKFWCYTPDFRVNNIYYEVKGYWDYKSLRKRKLFAEQYPNITIFYIDQPKYETIKCIFKKIIPSWEN